MHRINDLLKRCVDMDGSDLHFKCDTGKVYCRVHGDLIHLEDEPHFSDAEFREQLSTILRPDQLARFDKELELDFAYEIPGISRFRGNAYQQRSHMQAAFRVIPYHINNMEDLQLPPACYDFIQRPRGLVLVTGPAGSGKSTTLAAMVDRINRTHKSHIITVEDPIEFVHDNHVALINQRELEVDTMSFANALKYVLRQDPDVILVGEMRDLETIHLAITAAETGHLVFGTLHTRNAPSTIDRIIDVFPSDQQDQIRVLLGNTLEAVVSQQLLPRLGGGRVAGIEIMLGTAAIKNLIREGKTHQMYSMIETSQQLGMQTMDSALAAHFRNGNCSYEECLMRAVDKETFTRLAKGG